MKIWGPVAASIRPAVEMADPLSLSAEAFLYLATPCTWGAPPKRLPCIPIGPRPPQKPASKHGFTIQG
ncbi:hypothetical protein PMIN01_01473 [Paraphaeosphaeria minitans]|uniref:Uncharacterized protein n=1 Tax=Paraphaeosphaeria minitans TaxID=565426 RepID=A0A9P6GXG0_9PLEO|nr:hypothetical protein PMIN01_01473 [Paraphaeosphaeria minitans]